ncbi:MAG: PAS domain-containing protein [Candidatus Omnitrophica bacterium]|nr:PAS domain-containing protein [Candidatus Omnitrophota bacterium]
MPGKNKKDFSFTPQPASLKKILQYTKNLGAVLDAAAMVIITKPSGEIIYVNDNFCKRSRYSRKELLGKDFKIFGSGYHTKKFFEDLWRIIKQGKTWEGEIQNKSKDGAVLWLNTMVVPLCHEDKKPYQYVWIYKDITSLKELNSCVRVLTQKIIQMQEKEREQIAAEIHDGLAQTLATLKMVIQTTISQICTCGCCVSSGPAVKQILEYLDPIVDNARSLMSQLRPSTLEVLGVGPSIRELTEDLRTSSGLKVRASLKALDDVHFKGEAINLYRIVQEIFNNITEHSRATYVSISSRKQDGWLTVTVRDNGKGLCLKNDCCGGYCVEGLGITVMRERARILGGEVFVHSGLGKGTTIMVKVPLSERKRKT